MFNHIESFIEKIGLNGVITESNPIINFVGCVNNEQKKGRMIKIENYKTFGIYFVGFDKQRRKKTIELMSEGELNN